MVPKQLAAEMASEGLPGPAENTLDAGNTAAHTDLTAVQGCPGADVPKIGYALGDGLFTTDCHIVTEASRP